MNRKRRILITLCILLVAAVSVSLAQQTPDRTVLPIQEPKRPEYKELDVRNAKMPSHLEVKAPAGHTNEKGGTVCTVPPSGGIERTGNELLSRTLVCSIIAAEALHRRVRDGNGCYVLAMVTSPKGLDNCTGTAGAEVGAPDQGTGRVRRLRLYDVRVWFVRRCGAGVCRRMMRRGIRIEPRVSRGTRPVVRPVAADVFPRLTFCDSAVTVRPASVL